MIISITSLVAGLISIIFTNPTIYYQIGIFVSVVCFSIAIASSTFAYKLRQKIKLLKNEPNQPVSCVASIQDPINPTGSTDLSKILTSLNTAVFADATIRGSKVSTTEPLPHELLTHKSLSKVMALHQEALETGKVPVKKLKKIKISPMSSISSLGDYDMNPVFYDNKQKKRINKEFFSKAVTKWPRHKHKANAEDI